MLNSRCSVIAAANPTFGSYNDDSDTIEQHDFKATILSRFDIIFLLKDKEDIDRDTTLCKHILSLHAVSEGLYLGKKSVCRHSHSLEKADASDSICKTNNLPNTFS